MSACLPVEAGTHCDACPANDPISTVVTPKSRLLRAVRSLTVRKIKGSDWEAAVASSGIQGLA